MIISNSFLYHNNSILKCSLESSYDLSSRRVGYPAFVVDDTILDYLRKGRLLQTAECPVKSKIHVVPGSKYNIADVRRNYQIKRKNTEADYVVFPSNPLFDVNTICQTYIYVERLQLILISNPGNVSLLDKYNIKPGEYIQVPKCLYGISFISPRAPWDKRLTNGALDYIDLLSGQIKSIPIGENCLNMSSEVPLTLKALELSYSILSQPTSPWDSSMYDSVKMHVRNLAMSNWRACSGTVTLLFHSLPPNSYGYMLFGNKSGLPKCSKELLHCYSKVPKPVSEIDRKLGREWCARYATMMGFCNQKSIPSHDETED